MILTSQPQSSAKDTVRVLASQDAPLPASTTAGVGPTKTITATANGALVVDSVGVVTYDRVAVAYYGGFVISPHNGIYVVTDPGSPGTPWILTRAQDFNGVTGPVRAGDFFTVAEGAVSGDTVWGLRTDNPVTVDTTPLEFVDLVTALSNADITGVKVLSFDGLVPAGDKAGTGITLVDWTKGAIQEIRLVGNVVNPVMVPPPGVARVTLIINQDIVGGRTITGWPPPPNFRIIGGTLGLSIPGLAMDLITFMFLGGSRCIAAPGLNAS